MPSSHRSPHIPDWDTAARAHGGRASLLPVSRLGELRQLILRAAGENELNGFQRWIVEDMYRFDPPAPSAGSVLLLALPHPFYADVRFSHGGREFVFPCPVALNPSASRAWVDEAASRAGFRLWPAERLPLKRVAVHSGLAKYGRNNLAYVPGLGSNLCFVAFFTDCPCESDPWTTDVAAPECAGCGRCVRACPTGAILPGRFLIDNLRCLSCLNDSPDEFPDWLPAEAHHTLYDCLRCQQACPMNEGRLNKAEDEVWFSAEDTDRLLNGGALSSFSPDARRKFAYLGLEPWFGAIPRNLRALINGAAHQP